LKLTAKKYIYVSFCFLGWNLQQKIIEGLSFVSGLKLTAKKYIYAPVSGLKLTAKKICTQSVSGLELTAKNYRRFICRFVSGLKLTSKNIYTHLFLGWNLHQKIYIHICFWVGTYSKIPPDHVSIDKIECSSVSRMKLTAKNEYSVNG